MNLISKNITTDNYPYKLYKCGMQEFFDWEKQFQNKIKSEDGFNFRTKTFAEIDTELNYYSKEIEMEENEEFEILSLMLGKNTLTKGLYANYIVDKRWLFIWEKKGYQPSSIDIIESFLVELRREKGI